MDFVWVTWRLITREGAHYFVYTFVGSVCVLQLAAAFAGLRGMWFFPRRLWVYLTAGAGLLGDFWWFFHVADRNTPAIAGSEQFLIFLGSGLTALAFTLALSSWLRGGELRDRPWSNPTYGLEALKEHTYWQAINASRQGKRREDVPG